MDRNNVPRRRRDGGLQRFTEMMRRLNFYVIFIGGAINRWHAVPAPFLDRRNCQVRFSSVLRTQRWIRDPTQPLPRITHEFTAIRCVMSSYLLAKRAADEANGDQPSNEAFQQPTAAVDITHRAVMGVDARVRRIAVAAAPVPPPARGLLFFTNQAELDDLEQRLRMDRDEVAAYKYQLTRVVNTAAIDPVSAALAFVVRGSMFRGFVCRTSRRDRRVDITQYAFWGHLRDVIEVENGLAPRIIKRKTGMWLSGRRLDERRNL